MKKIFQISIFLLIALSLFSCVSNKNAANQTNVEQNVPEGVLGNLTEKDYVDVQEAGIHSSTRDALIPAYISLPKDFSKEAKSPMVIMLHGHGGNHNEWGGFDAISDGLAHNGIVTVTLDYSGCGASTEKFTLNTMTNMKQDTIDVISYVVANYNIDTDKIGGFGYSMGGRIMLELLADNKVNFATIDLVAPAEDLEDLKDLFGGHDNFDVLQAKAEKEGYAEFSTIYSTLPLSKEWFNDLYANEDGLVEKAAQNYKNDSLVIWATDDAAVRPFVSENVAKVLGSKVLNTYSDGHSYSFYSTTPDNKITVDGGSIDWFVSHLK